MLEDFCTNVLKFLGVYLNDHLTWKHHMSFLCKQVAKSVGMLFRSRFYLSSKTKLTLFYTLVYSYITYSNFTWWSTFFYLQKRAVFLNLSVTSRQVHNYGSRTADNCRSHPCHTNLKQFTILYQGPKIWTSLPASITCSSSLPSFKKKLLEVLLIKQL